MDTLTTIKERRSIRRFKSQDITDDTLEKLVDAARWAPSAGNVQPWEFVVIRKPDTKKSLADAAFNQAFIEQAPAAIVVCADIDRAYQSYGVRGKTLYCLQDTAAAAQNIHLAAYSLGLGTCWVGAFDEQKVAKALKTPSNMRPVAIIPVGYPDEAPPPRRRRSLDEITHKEEF